MQESADAVADPFDLKASMQVLLAAAAAAAAATHP
jgi:hypothetical protein